MTKVAVTGPEATVAVTGDGLPTRVVTAGGDGSVVAVGDAGGIDAIRWRGILLDPTTFKNPEEGWVPRFDADLGRWFAASPGALSVVDWDNVLNKPATFPPSAHNHDDRYFTETESDARFAALVHTHDDRYFTEAESDARFAALVHTHAAGDVVSGTFADARIAASNVTQHQAALAIGWGQLTGVPATFTPSAHRHAVADLDDFGAAGGYLRSTGAAWARVSGVAWADLTGVPATFTPSAHTHPLADVTGFGAVGGYIRSDGGAWVRVSGLAWADVTGAPAFALDADLDAHVADLANPHAVTKAQVGLGNVENTALSTWAGSANITTLGTIGTGVWNATAIAWAKVDKTGSSLADLATRDVADLTGTTLPASIVTSSLTTVGTLAAGAVPASLVTGGTFGAGNFQFAYGVLGIGAAPDPGFGILVVREGGIANTRALTYSDTATDSAGFNGQRARGTIALPTAVLAEDNLVVNSFAGYTGSVFFNGSRMIARAAENWSSGARGTKLVFETTPIGDNSANESLIIHDNATLQVNGILMRGLTVPFAMSSNAAGTTTAGMLVQSQGANAGFIRQGASTTGFVLSLNKTRGTVTGSRVALLSGDVIAQINASGDDATDLGTQGGKLVWAVTGTVSTNRLPTKFSIYTAAGTVDDDISEKVSVLGTGDTSINATAKFRLDGVAGTGDTYVVESSANVFDLVAGGATTLRLSATAATVTGTLTASGDAGLAATKKLYLDGVALSGNTYLVESSADVLDLVAGGATTVRVNATVAAITGNLTATGDFGVAATKKLYLDGVALTGNTYIAESSADVIQVTAGGNLMLTMNATQMGFFGHALATRASAYTPTNVTTDRAYNANATTVDELADVLGTVIADLQSYGLLQ